MILLAIIVFVILYFVVSLILMVSWNKGVKPALKNGAVNTISYPQAMAMTLFVAMVSGGSVIVLRPSAQKAMAALPLSSAFR